MAKIILIDDHVLLRNGLAALLENLGHEVLFEANNGEDMIRQIKEDDLPHIAMLDINMPVMDGFEAAAWLKKNHPGVKVLALSMYDNESSIIKMLKNGAKGYLLKDSDPMVLKNALHDLEEKGFYYSDLVNGKLVHALANSDDDRTLGGVYLTERERTFLTLACSELTYKEISEQMNVSPRTIDGYRDTLFEKLEIRSRVGLAIYAIKSGLVKVTT